MKQSGRALVCVLVVRIFIERAARSSVGRAAFPSPSRICALPSEASADARSKLVVASSKARNAASPALRVSAKSLRRILGWERSAQVPSEATFSRAFAEFAQGDLPDKMHAALIERALGGRIIGAIARDATEIEAREKPAPKVANDKKDNPPPPDGAQPPRKRGRPRKDAERPKPKPTRLERQTSQNVNQMLAELPSACDVGSKKNSKILWAGWRGRPLGGDRQRPALRQSWSPSPSLRGAHHSGE